MKRLIGIVAALAFAGAWIAVCVPVLRCDSSQTNLEWFGHLTAVLALVVATSLLVVMRLDLKGLVVGKDNRLSTSKLQALIWTYAIAAGLLSLVISNWGGADDGYVALLAEGLKDEYLLLLGGPFAAAILAKGIVTAKADAGDITKTEGTPELSQAVSDDTGNTDLVDTQYLLFNLVALAFFVGAFVTQPEDGFPEIPEILVALTGISAATYVSNKAVLKEKPTLRRILPSRGKKGTEVTIYGNSLLLPKLSDGKLEFDPPTVTFNEVSATVKNSQSTTTGQDRLTVEVPELPGVTVQTGVNVQVFNAAGVESNTLVFTIEP